MGGSVEIARRELCEFRIGVLNTRIAQIKCAIKNRECADIDEAVGVISRADELIELLHRRLTKTTGHADIRNFFEEIEKKKKKKKKRQQRLLQLQLQGEKQDKIIKIED